MSSDLEKAGLQVLYHVFRLGGALPCLQTWRKPVCKCSTMSSDLEKAGLQVLYHIFRLGEGRSASALPCLQTWRRPVCKCSTISSDLEKAGLQVLYHVFRLEESRVKRKRKYNTIANLFYPLKDCKANPAVESCSTASQVKVQDYRFLGETEMSYFCFSKG